MSQRPSAARWLRSFLSLVLTLLLCGCPSSPPRPPLDGNGGTTGPDLRVPLPDDDTAATEASGAGPGTDATTTDTGSASRQASQTASFALLEQSRDAEATGNRAAAITYLERALRLTPRSAVLWIELGRLQLPGAPVAAQRYARKALALTRQDTETYQQAWLLIADAKELDGDRASAEAIRDRFRTGTG
ncbi:MAG: tetratricopeptide repeat protein [Pseudomonadota bacterium]